MKGLLKAYLDLTKPRITWLILMSTGIGYFFGLPDGWAGIDFLVLLHTLIGTGLLASGTAALNQWYERDADAKMNRTKARPLPLGLMPSANAFWFGVALSIAGFADLAWAVNWLTAILGLLTLVSYLFLYTPLKRVTPHSTTIGAIPGAMPPLIGFAAAAGTLTAAAWVLFAILFLWQFPHFYAIAWMYRDDYARAGIRMLPVVEPDGESTARRIFWLTVLLIPVSLLPVALSMAGKIYLAAAVILGAWFLRACFQVRRNRNGKAARSVLLASVAYLPLLYIAMLGGCVKSGARDLPDYYGVPEFRLTTQDNAAFNSLSMRGKIWVADFVFTTCTTFCPRMTALFERIQEADPGVALVSFTVDPDTDTPDLLKAYARNNRADPARWTFLTGPRDTLKSVRQETFKLGEMETPLMHSNRMVLVDREMRIRGFYDSTDADAFERIMTDVRLLQAR